MEEDGRAGFEVSSIRGNAKLLAMKKANPVGLAFYWWRRRESNPRPWVLRYRYYMLSFVYWFRAPDSDEQDSGLLA